MLFTKLKSGGIGDAPGRVSRRNTPAARPALEGLEDRWVPSTLTVTSISDKGPGSLRADISAARSGDTIVFAPSLDGKAITLKSELLVDRNLTIAGPSDRGVTVSGNNGSRAFEVAQGMQVALSGLTISNGFATNGAGILVDTGAVLAVSNSTLSGNSATKSQKYVANWGGGIDNYGTATVSNCTISNNTSYGGGGGIYNHGTLTVNNDSIVSRNLDVGVANTGTARISCCTLSGNDGSAIYNFAGATITVLDSLLTGNSASDGGGIYDSGSATISNCTLSGNSAAEYGGGIYLTSNSSGSGTLTVSGCTLSGNESTRDSGGGVYIVAGTAMLSGCTLSGNTAAGVGGGIYLYGGFGGTLTVGGTILSGNSAEYGGGIFIDGGSVTLENFSSITGNTAPDGFGADVYNLGALYVDNTIDVMNMIVDGNAANPI